MNFIKDQEHLEKKIVLLRLDLNVPIKNGIITDHTRIDKILPIINFLLKKKSKILIVSHVGRPKGKKSEEFSLKPICLNLEIKLKKKIYLIKKNIFNLKKKHLFQDPNYQINFLENIRFYKEEETNDINFSEHLASLADIFVNDAFSCSHRAHASVSEVTKFIPSYAGIQLETELNALKKVTSEIKKPISCIIGGSKISSKIGLIKNLIPRFDNIIIVGAMANNILSYKGYPIGKSKIEDNCNNIVDDIFTTAKYYSCSIFYPEDVAVGKSLEDEAKIKEINEVISSDLILDIGPKTVKKIKDIIEASNSILWNGPVGYFENPNFAKGCYEIAKKIVEKNKHNLIYSVAGGGDTIAVLNKVNAINNFNFVSTAGGAFLEYLEGKELPGIKALN